MKSMKRALSIFLAVMMLVSAVSVVAGVSATADEAAEETVFLTQFTEDNFVAYGTYLQDMKDENGATVKDEDGKVVQEEVVVPAKSITYNDDFSIRIESDGPVLGVRSIFKVDEGAKDAFAQCIAAADADYQANLEAAEQKAKDEGTEFNPDSVAKVSPYAMTRVFIENSTSERGLQLDCQAIFTLVMKDGTTHKLNTEWLGYKQTKNVKVIFSYSVPTADGTGTETYYMENFDDVESIQVEMYHWELGNRVMVISSPVASGTPVIPEQPKVVPDAGAGVGTTIIEFARSYRQDYSNEPDRVLYSTTGADDDFKQSGTGYAKFDLSRAGEPGRQKQAYFKFDRDAAAKGIAAANQEGGSGMAEMTITLISSVDQHGNPVKAEFDILLSTFNNGYVSIVKAWQDPGTSVTYMFDVSDYTDYNLSGIRLAAQNYWYYDEDGNVVEFGKSNTAQNGTGVEEIYIRPSVVFSPITVSNGEQKEQATVTTAEATTQSDGPIEGAGYEFFLYEKETQAVEWGNAPAEVRYNENGTVSLVSPKGVARNPGSDVKQHQMGWLTKTSEDNKTVISDEKAAEVQARMQQALDYANAPGAPGLLAVDVTVNNAFNPGNNKTCSAEILFIIHASGDYSVRSMQYVGYGQTKTLYIDVSGLPDASVVNSWHIAAQNYANTDEETGRACGIVDVDVTYSTPYVAGSALATTQIVTVGADDSVAKELADLYNDLPKNYDSYVGNETLYNKLEQFISMYVDAGIATQELLESEYGITMDDYAVLLEIWNELPAFGPDDVETGSAAIPICSVVLAIGAAYVIKSTRKKK